MKPVYEQDRGDIQADMYAYGLAAENNGVRHMQLDQYMVSNADAGGEGWPFVDTEYATLSCDVPVIAAGHHRPTL
jgi:hypothetical protein